MDIDLEHDYYAIQMTGAPYNDEWVIVPKSWIKLSDLEESDDVVLKYPLKKLAGLEQWVKDKKEYMKEWGIYAGHAKYGNNSYEDVKEYIRKCTTTSDIEEPQVKRTKNEERNSETERHETPTKINELQVIHMQCTEKPCESKIDTMKGSTQQLYNEEASKATVNTLNTDVTKEILNRRNDIVNLAFHLSNHIKSKKVLSEEYVTLVNKTYVELKESCDTIGLLYKAYIEKCSVVKKMIDLITTYKKQSNYSPKSCNSTVKVSADKKLKQEKEEDCQIRSKADKKNYVTEKLSGSIEKQQNQKEAVENEMKVEGEMLQTVKALSMNKGYTVIADDRLEMPQTQNIILPLDCDEDDSRWTLRHHFMKKGLIELEKHTGVYVDAVKLGYFTVKFKRNAQALAQNLAVEVFSDEALTTCSLRGEKAKPCKNNPQRPGLNACALKAIFNYVYEQTGVRNTAELENTIRNKLLEIKRRRSGCHRSKKQ